MRLTTLLRASPFLLLAGLAAVACGGNVTVSNTGGAGGSGVEPIGFADCSGPGQCVLVTNGCCDTCGEPTLGVLVPINGALATQFHTAVCPSQPPCPKCATQNNPNLFAYCEEGHCRGNDVRVDPVSDCTADDDCTLRDGLACCESCFGDTSQLVAVAKSANLSALLCAPGQACDECAPQYPDIASAICVSGHCEVHFGGLGGP
ncbi:MAG: hypothetical protein QM820_61145 [Minicystis sp.]